MIIDNFKDFCPAWSHIFTFLINFYNWRNDIKLDQLSMYEFVFFIGCKYRYIWMLCSCVHHIYFSDSACWMGAVANPDREESEWSRKSGNIKSPESMCWLMSFKLNVYFIKQNIHNVLNFLWKVWYATFNL